MNYCQEGLVSVNTLTTPVAIMDCTVSGEQKNREDATEMSPFMG